MTITMMIIITIMIVIVRVIMMMSGIMIVTVVSLTAQWYEASAHIPRADCGGLRRHGRRPTAAQSPRRPLIEPGGRSTRRFEATSCV